MSRIFLISIVLLVLSLTSTQSYALANDQISQQDSWQQIMPGLERRTYLPNDAIFSQILAVRIDTQLFGFRLLYEPNIVRSTTEWVDYLPPDVVLFVNASFFDHDRRPLGLLIIEDALITGAQLPASGFVYQAADSIGIASSLAQIYTFNNLDLAFEGTPLLIRDSQAVYFNTLVQRRTRRTVFAEDDQGNVILLVTPFIGLSLSELTEFLVDSDLGIVHALNLDGGRSTMIAIPSEEYQVIAFDRIPVILGVYAK